MRVSATQVGIELSPDACRIVEIEAAPFWARRPWSVPTRVRAFAVLPPSGPDTEAKLASLKNRRAAVIVWGAASDHRQVIVDAGSYESMRAEAIRALDAVGVETRGAWVDIAPVSRASERKSRRPVIAVVAAAAELTSAVQPLYNAGIRVDTIVTPAVALGSLARLRRNISTPNALELYVALEERATCLALVRGRVLMASQTRDWGFINEFGADLQPRSRDEIVTWLTVAIPEFLAAIGAAATDITQICLSGALPELRSMTAPLMERFDVEVEPLDSLFRINAEQLPEPADEFRERGAELRLAWAAAADWPPSLNMLRARQRQASKTRLARGAVAAGVVAGLLVGWRVQQSASWRRTASRPAATTARAAPPPAASSASASARVPPPAPTAPKAPAIASNAPAVANRTAPTAPAAAAPTPPPLAVRTPTPITAPPPASPAPTARREAVVPRTDAPAPPERDRARAAAPSAQAASQEPPRATAREPVRLPPAQPPVRFAAPAVGQPTARTASRGAPPSDAVLGFDAVLGTILYSPDRKLAIIDGRIVAPGDEIRGARIVDITATSVLLRDDQGRLRRLTLASKGR